MYSVIQKNQYVDLVFLSKDWDREDYYLNYVRSDKWNPDEILNEIYGIPIKKPVSLQSFTSHDYYDSQENFILQFEDQNKVFHLTLCGFSQKFTEGKCSKCPKTTFNLDPQGESCMKCTDHKEFFNHNDTMRHVRDGVCYGYQPKPDYPDYEGDKKKAGVFTSDIFDFDSCRGAAGCIAGKTCIILAILALAGVFGYMIYYWVNPCCTSSGCDCSRGTCCNNGSQASRRAAKLQKTQCGNSEEGAFFVILR
jgi:hypothetical protein